MKARNCSYERLSPSALEAKNKRADLFVDKSRSDQTPTEMMVTKIALSTEWQWG